MLVDLTKEQVLDVIEDNLEELIQPISSLISVTGWDDIAFTKFIESKTFIKEIAEILVEKEVWKELVEEIEVLTEHY